jgi:hypothetical protein
LDIESSPVSENIKRIVEYINSNAKCTRKKLLEALAPTPKVVKPTVIEIAPAAPAGEGEVVAEPAKPAEPKAPEATPEQTAILVDLHWLIHQGAVLEFADGRMETAKKPMPKPVKQEKKPAAGKPAAESEPAAAAETIESIEVAPEAETAAPVVTEAAASEVPPAAETAPTA